LKPEVLSLLESSSNDLVLSAASSWEISIKYALGKLPLPEPPSRYIPSRMASSGSSGLAVEHAHAIRVAELPPHHRDPFDRLLVAQAQIEKLVLLTADRQFESYDVKLRFG
jgi:PIN domain nuclease of toxin-antitoxin system